MENNKEMKIIAPDGCEIDKINIVDGAAIILFKKVNKKLPKSWEEFCYMFPKYGSIFYINDDSEIKEIKQVNEKRFVDEDKTTFSDRATAEAVLALCQLIQLRNIYNGDWVPKCNDYTQKKYVIFFNENELRAVETHSCENRLLIFKSSELRDEFLRNFRPLIEKLKLLYGIKEGGEE
jgi:hypothetical protein